MSKLKMTKFKNTALSLFISAFAFCTTAAYAADNNSLVLYFSMAEQSENSDAITGATDTSLNTQNIANLIVKNTKAKAVRLESEFNYTNDPKVLKDEVSKIDPALDSVHFKNEDLSKLSDKKIDHLYLGFPVWLHHAPAEIYTFLKANKDNLKGVKVSFYTTSAHFDSKDLCDSLKTLIPGAKVTPELSVQASDRDNLEKKVKDYTDSLSE